MNIMTIRIGSNSHKDIDKIGRQTALNLASLMARVEYDFNRHEPCLVCDEKYKHHIDGLPCESDDSRKQIIRSNRWNTHIKTTSARKNER